MSHDLKTGSSDNSSSSPQDFYRRLLALYVSPELRKRAAGGDLQAISDVWKLECLAEIDSYTYWAISVANEGREAVWQELDDEEARYFDACYGHAGG